MRDLDAEIAKAKERKAEWDKEQELRDIKQSMRRIKLPTTTKLIVLYIFANLTAVEVYSMVAMWYFADFDSLYALISAVIGESITFAVYAAKAYLETKAEESNKLRREELGLGTDDDEEAMG